MPAALLAHVRSAMPAYVVKRSHSTALIANDDEALTRDVSENVIARALKMLSARNADPLAREYSLALRGEDVFGSVPLRGKRFLFSRKRRLCEHERGFVFRLKEAPAPNMIRHYDAVVLGLGGIGSGAAYWLAKRGASVLGLEQFGFGHDRGSSHDHSRIIRFSYHAPHYVRLANEAYAAWSTLEADTHTQLVYKTGGLDLGPRDGAIPLEDFMAALDACAVPYEHLDAQEIRNRFPPFRIGDEIHGIFQADSGIVAAERATQAHQEAATHFGATLKERTRISAIRERAGEIEVEADGERFSAGSLVIAAGAWTPQALAHFDVRIPFEVTKEQPMYFRIADASTFDRTRFPIWIWQDKPSFYGLPTFGEEGCVKITQDHGGKAVDPDTRTFEPDFEMTERVRAFLDEHLPSASGAPKLTKTCLYAQPPDWDFILSKLPDHPRVHVAVGGGHGFKFAGVFGRILSDLVLDGSTASDIEHFKIDRRMPSQPSLP